jgi:hypothetical protein
MNNKNYDMKLNITNLIFFGVGIILISTSCKKEGGYDWTKIEPGKQQITGPDSIKGNDSTVYEYLAMTRGGSTYTWAVLNGPLTIKVDTLNHDPLHYHPFRVEITADSKIDTSAQIIVRETTWAGKQGESDTFEIKKIACYIRLDWNKFVGNNTCNETILNPFKKMEPFDVDLIHVGGDTLVNENFYGIDWQLKYVLSHDKNETLKVINATFEDSNNPIFDGPFEVRGNGTYSTCNGTITVNLFFIDKTIGDTVYSVIDQFKHQ